MTSKERMLAAFKGEKTDVAPVTPHWWGLYKFEFAGLIRDYRGEREAWHLSGEALAGVDAHFFEAFRPDMLHLTAGASRFTESDAVRAEKKRLLEAVGKLESSAVIDEYVDSVSQKKAQVLGSGVFDHVRILSARYGGEALILLNEGNPICDVLDPSGCVGFERGLIALMEQPDRMEYLIRRLYECRIPRMAALYEAGAHGYIGSETYCAPDILSPALYRQIIFPAQRHFYRALDTIGLIPVTYFLGDILPLIEDIKRLNVRALMVEEGKKNYHLEIGEIYRALERSVCLFGNMDSVYTLERGTPAQVVAETRRQLAACPDGGFVMANGCPVSFGTPPENLRAMMAAARTQIGHTKHMSLF